MAGIASYTFGAGHLHPYLFLGAGIAFNSYTRTNLPRSPTPKTSFAETDFYMAPGPGILDVFASDRAMYLQARTDRISRAATVWG